MEQADSRTIEIRAMMPARLQDFYDMQQLEQLVWHVPETVPLHQTVTVAKNGGILLAAFDGNLMVGLLYSFPGFLNKQVYLCSHMLGIREDWRHYGLGEKLKLAQAEAARAAGYSLVTWTYDPLESVNGNLNIGKLGGVCSAYIENCYGEMNDAFNQGLPSDRFQVAWWIDRPSPVLPEGTAYPAVCWRLAASGLPEPVAMSEWPLKAVERAALVSVAVPADIQAIKEQDINLANMWRQTLRQACSALFASGWVVAGFRRLSGTPVNEYMAVRQAALGLPKAPWDMG